MAGPQPYHITPSAQMADHQCLRLHTGTALGNDIAFTGRFLAESQTDDPEYRKQPQYPGIVIDFRQLEEEPCRPAYRRP